MSIMKNIDKARVMVLKDQVSYQDSRDCPKGSIFFALKGESFNGNAFAAKALEQGVERAQPHRRHLFGKHEKGGRQQPRGNRKLPEKTAGKARAAKEKKETIIIGRGLRTVSGGGKGNIRTRSRILSAAW